MRYGFILVPLHPAPGLLCLEQSPALSWVSLLGLADLGQELCAAASAPLRAHGFLLSGSSLNSAPALCLIQAQVSGEAAG